MNKKPKSSWSAGTLIAVGVATGAGMFAATNEPLWIAVGIGMGAALSLRKRR